MNYLFARGSSGSDVKMLKDCLLKDLGTDAAAFPGLKVGDIFDADTEAALRRWQSGMGMVADGIGGPHCATLMGLRKMVKLEIVPNLAAIRRLFPQTKPSNIVRYLPYVTDALEVYGLTDRLMILAALGTIRAETAGFVPIAEYVSQFNTRPGMAPFSAYEPGEKQGDKLGNKKTGDGFLFRGRGFVQLTGRYNYETWEKQLKIGLTVNPDIANGPEVAAVLLASYLAHYAEPIRKALAASHYAGARKLVNGGTHGVDAFKDVFVLAEAIWPPERAPKAGMSRRTGAAPVTSQRPLVGRTRSTLKDPPDLRDRMYQPPPMLLPDQFPSDTDIAANLDKYKSLVLDQGQEGACTGFGLACVINFARWQKTGFATGLESVSPRMLYNFARRYDEYAGENYEGSSCRGALKGWFNHGVCLESDWPYDTKSRPRYGFAKRAAQTTLGVYYRIAVKSIVDIQAAIYQAHTVFVSASTHDGWDLKASQWPARPRHKDLPVIGFDGRPSKQDGHAFALVGFNATGFVIQNSWGSDYGLGGFAVLTYADWMANGMDAWVASLGVSGVVEATLATAPSDPDAGRKNGRSNSATASAWWNDVKAYEHSVVLGNDGRVNRYLTPDELGRSLVYQACTLPDQWFRSDAAAMAAPVKRLVIYAHGGLNSESDAISRARAMGRFFTDNGCYPLFLVWKTGLLESLGDIVADKLRREPQRVGGIREAFADATDLVIEKTLGRGPGRAIWSEMKENAEFACNASRGGDQLVTALQQLQATWGDQLEIHLVGHSAGAIILGHLLTLLSARRLEPRIASVHLYAPACTVQFANRHYAPQARIMQRLFMYVLADAQERDDNVVSIYRKSLLYLVANALEPDIRTPILGLDNIRNAAYAGWDGSSSTGEALGNWRAAMEATQLDKERTTVVATRQVPVRRLQEGAADRVESTSASHGSFDNNLDVVTRTLERIIGGKLAAGVDDLRGF